MNIFGIAGTIVSVSAQIMMATQRYSASKDINRANKIISSTYLAKFLGKATSEKEKETIAKSRTNAFNAYLVNATNYGATDAAGIAHAAQSKEVEKNKTKILLVALMFNLIVVVTFGYFTIAVAMIIVAILAIFYKEHEVGMNMISILGITLPGTKILSILDMILIYYNVKSGLVKTMRLILETLLAVF